MKYFDLIKPTYIENWTRELCSLSFAQSNIELSFKDEVEPILEFVWNNKPTKILDIIINKIDNKLQQYPNGVFIRLGSRSPKDIDIICVKNGKQAMNLLLQSVRVFDDLCLAFQNKYNPHIFLREWQNISEPFEFRCFMKNNKLIGISQYNYNKTFTEIEDNKDIIVWGIQNFFKSFKNASHLDTVIFDVFLNYRTVLNQKTWEIKLLEINPFCDRTDPCLFDWRNIENFQGQFLFNKNEK